MIIECFFPEPEMAFQKVSDVALYFDKKNGCIFSSKNGHVSLTKAVIMANVCIWIRHIT